MDVPGTRTDKVGNFDRKDQILRYIAGFTSG